MTLARSLSRQGFPARAFAIALDLHETALHRGDELATVETADCLAACCYMMARYEQGIGFARTARALWQARGEPVRQAGAGSQLAIMMATIGEPEAVTEAGAALQLAEKAGDGPQLIDSLRLNGRVLALLQQPERGLAFSKRAVALSRRLKHPHGMAVIDLAEVTFTPTSASWLNAVEGFFAKLTKQRLRRGVFHSLVSLQAAINRYVAQANDDPRPFHWTKDPDKIIAAVRRGHQVVDSIH